MSEGALGLEPETSVDRTFLEVIVFFGAYFIRAPLMDTVGHSPTYVSTICFVNQIHSGHGYRVAYLMEIDASRMGFSRLNGRQKISRRISSHEWITGLSGRRRAVNLYSVPLMIMLF